MKIYAAVIGTGIGLKHFEAINNYKNSKVLLVYEKNKRRSLKLKKIFPDIKFVDTENEIFSNKRINLISIASYDNYHFKQILLCLKKDINVIIEKPICLKFEELIKIKKALKKSKAKITSNMVLRVNDLFCRIKKMINPKNVYYIEGDYIWGRKKKIFGWRSKVNNFSFTLGAAIHIIDLICWFLNERPTSIMSFGSNLITKNTKFKKKSFLIYILKFPNQKIVKITANMVGIHEHFHDIKIFTSKNTYIHNYNKTFKIVQEKNKLKNINLNYKYPDKLNRKKMIRNFIDHLHNKKIKQVITQKEIFDLMSICFAADDSLKQKKEMKIKYLK